MRRRSPAGSPNSPATPTPSVRLLASPPALGPLTQGSTSEVDNGRPLISTFSGETTTLGGASLSDGWQAALKTPLTALSPPVNPAFVPAWTGLPGASAVTDNPVVDGIFPWSAWSVSAFCRRASFGPDGGGRSGRWTTRTSPPTLTSRSRPTPSRTTRSVRIGPKPGTLDPIAVRTAVHGRRVADVLHPLCVQGELPPVFFDRLSSSNVVEQNYILRSVGRHSSPALQKPC